MLTVSTTGGPPTLAARTNAADVRVAFRSQHEVCQLFKFLNAVYFIEDMIAECECVLPKNRRCKAVSNELESLRLEVCNEHLSLPVEQVLPKEAALFQFSADGYGKLVSLLRIKSLC